jgi:hypothetical protein
MEVMVAAAAAAVLLMAVVTVWATESQMLKSGEKRLATIDGSARVEDALTTLFQGSRLTTATTDTTSYFESETDGNSSDLGCDRVTFTTDAPSMALSAYFDSGDFETQNTNRGPIGGLAEVSLGLVAVGDSQGKSGLFERIQRPSDSDLTQGGKEFLISDQVTSIAFEFWDGQQWQTTWDTLTSSTGRRLPQAVQVSYTLKNDTANGERSFIIPLPASDVNSNSIYTTDTSTSSTGGS